MLTMLVATVIGISCSFIKPAENKPEWVKKSEKVQVAPDFTLTDINGQKVSLKDFRGKVVYMDIWATWCAPCMISIKKSKPLKEHYKNNPNVVFLYVSIDKDVERWKKVVHEKEIKGVHLISVGGSEENILQKYNADYIPRYVLIDKNGNISAANAKGPEDSDLINDIDKLLEK
ncbi:MAG: TlpA family protein disulfide reductase [Cytophagaceae bacterium]